MADGDFDQSVYERLERLDREAQEMRTKIERLEEELSRVERMGVSLAQAMIVAHPERLGDVPERFRPEQPAVGSEVRVERQVRPATRRTEHGGDRPERVRHGEMIEWCTEILRDNGGPMHVSEIREALENGADKGWRVPGQGNDSNVSVHLARAGEFESTGERGVWRLKPGGQL